MVPKSVVSRPAAPTPSGNLLEMQTPEPCPRPAESATLSETWQSVLTSFTGDSDTRLISRTTAISSVMRNSSNPFEVFYRD